MTSKWCWWISCPIQLIINRYFGITVYITGISKAYGQIWVFRLLACKIGIPMNLVNQAASFFLQYEILQSKLTYFLWFASYTLLYSLFSFLVLLKATAALKSDYKNKSQAQLSSTIFRRGMPKGTKELYFSPAKTCYTGLGPVDHISHLWFVFAFSLETELYQLLYFLFLFHITTLMSELV